MSKLKFLLLNLTVALLLVIGISIYVLHWLNDYTRHGIAIAVPSFLNLTEDEAHEQARNHHLRVLVIDSLYNVSAKPGTVVEQSPSIGSPVKENRLIHLTLNARNPEKISFPNLKNAAYRQTVQTLETKGFNIGDISYEPSEYKNLVLKFRHQGKDIQAGELLRKGAIIDIVLGSGYENNFVYIPQFKGKTLKEAVQLIRNAYLNIEGVVPDESIATRTDSLRAFVYEQYPASGQKIQAGSFIKLYTTLKQEKIIVSDSLMITE